MHSTKSRYVFDVLVYFSGRSHPVRVSQSATDRRTVSQNQSPSRSPSTQLQTEPTRAQRRSTIYVEQGVESSSTSHQAEGDTAEVSTDVEVAEEATSEIAFQALHNSRGDTPGRHDSSSHEGSPAPQEIPLEDFSRRGKSKRKEQLTRARQTQSRLAAELKKQHTTTRSDSQSPKRRGSGDRKGTVLLRGRSTSLTSEATPGGNRSRSGTPERRLHSESSPLPSSVASKLKHQSKHSKEIQTQTLTSLNAKNVNNSKSDPNVNTATKTLPPAPSVSLVLETDQCGDPQLRDSPKLMPSEESDRSRTYSDISQTSSEMSQTSSEMSQSSTGSRSSTDSLNQLNLGLAVATGAGAELSQATVKVERLAPPTANVNRAATTKLTELAQMVQQYKFEGDSGEETTNVDQ